MAQEAPKRQWKCYDCKTWMNLNEEKCSACKGNRQKVQTTWWGKMTKHDLLADIQRRRTNQPAQPAQPPIQPPSQPTAQPSAQGAQQDEKKDEEQPE